jgi:hypothetical protein
MSIQKIDRYFLFLSIPFAVAGMLLGISMGMDEDFSFAAVHAHINLVGFVTLALFGIAYRIGWAAKDAWALVHFSVAGTGAVLLPLGIALVITDGQPALAIVGSVLTLASMLLFLINCIRALWADQASASREVAADSASNTSGAKLRRTAA